MTGRRHPNANDLFDIVRDMAARPLGKENVPKITADTRFGDLRCDDFDELQFIADVWHNFGIWVPDRVLCTFETVGNVMDYILDSDKYCARVNIKREPAPRYAGMPD